MLQPADLWDDRADSAPPWAQLIHRARLLGGDTRVVNPGGGNFSTKAVVGDHRGRPAELMWISGWGCDGAVLADGDLACLRVDDVRAARDGQALQGTTMFGYLAHCAARGGQPYPAIETLLHGYLRHAHVDHTHPEAVIALTVVDAGRKIAEAVFGDEAIWLDYEQFSPALASRLAAEIEGRPRARFVLLANHGLLTWADTSERCYRNTIEAATRSWQALTEARYGPIDLGGPAVPALDQPGSDDYLADLLPAIRGTLAAGGRPLVLVVDQDPTAIEFACSRRGPALSLAGPACPDSLVKMKRQPAVVDAEGGAPASRAAVEATIAAYRRDYAAYWTRHAPAGTSPPPGADLPRVLVLPGVGVVSAGEDVFAARLAEAHFRQTRRVVAVADAVGGYSSLTEAQAYADEYWPLLRDKPQLRPPAGELAGRVVLVAAGPSDGYADDPAHGRAATADAVRAVTLGLLAADAHVVLAGGGEALVAAIGDDLRDAGPATRPSAGRLTVAAGDRPVRAAVLAYGGVDVVVQLGSRAAASDLARGLAAVAERQGWRGHYVAVAGSRDAADAVLGAARSAGGDHVTAQAVGFDGDVPSPQRVADAVLAVIAVSRAGVAADTAMRAVGG